MDIHPLTLLTLAYSGDGTDVDALIARVKSEIAMLKKAEPTR